MWENLGISSGLLACLRILSCRYSDISLKAFWLTEFRTFGYNSEWFVIVLPAACQFLLHVCFTKQLVALEDISRWFCRQLWLGGRLGEDHLYWDIGQDYRYFPTPMFEASLAQILKFSERTFRCLFLSKAITFEPACGSAVSSKQFFTRVAFVGIDLLILPCIDSCTNEYKISNLVSKSTKTATWKLLKLLRAGFVLKLHPVVLPFRWIE